MILSTDINNENKLRSIHLFCGIALLSPKIGALDLSIVALIVVCIITLLKSKLTIKIPNKFLNLFFLWSLVIVSCLVTFVINGKVDSIFILKPFRQLILLFLSILIVISHKFRLVDIFKIVIIAAIINSSFVMIQLIGHNLFRIEHFMILPGFDINLDVPFRKPGFMSGYPHAGMLSVLGMLCLLNFIKKLNRLVFVFFWVLLSVSIILTSRTALFAGFVPLGIFILMGMRSKVAYQKLYLFLLFGAYAIIYILNILPEDSFNVAFEMFINFSNNKGFTSQSSAALADSYYFPNNLTTLFFGNGNFMRNDLNLNVDDGFQIMLYGCGIIYLILNCIIFIYYYLLSLKTVQNNLQKKIILFIFILIFLFNFKADALFSRVFSDILSLIVALGISTTFINLSFDKKTNIT